MQSNILKIVTVTKTNNNGSAHVMGRYLANAIVSHKSK